MRAHNHTIKTTGLKSHKWKTRGAKVHLGLVFFFFTRIHHIQYSFCYNGVWNPHLETGLMLRTWFHVNTYITSICV